MKKVYRIKKNEEFSKIINSKHYTSSACFVVYFFNKSKQNARAGISVSKKLGNAVERNKIKRQVREMLINILDFDSFENDLIIIVRKPYINKTFMENKNDLEILIKKSII